MATEVAICNRALSQMGSNASIASLSEQSPEALECNKLYAGVRDEIFSRALWSFARSAAVLTLRKDISDAVGDSWTSAIPAPPWAYEYAYPTDCARVRYVLPSSVSGSVAIFGQAATSIRNEIMLVEHPPIPFIIANGADDARVILTNQQDAMLIYTRKITSPAGWDARFEQAVVSELAARLAMPLSGRGDLAKANYSLAQHFIGKAQEADGNEGITYQEHMPDWIVARGYSAWVPS